MEGRAFELFHTKHVAMRFVGSLKKSSKEPSHTQYKSVRGTRYTHARVHAVKETRSISQETRDFHLDNFLNGILQNYFALVIGDDITTVVAASWQRYIMTGMTNVRDMTIV